MRARLLPVSGRLLQYVILEWFGESSFWTGRGNGMGSDCRRSPGPDKFVDVQQGHNRGFRNRRGRGDWGGRGQHADGHPPGPPGQEKVPGGHRRPYRRHVGFNPADPLAQGRPSGPDQRAVHLQPSYRPFSQPSGGPDYVTGATFDGGDVRRNHPPKGSYHRPRRSGLSGIGRQGVPAREPPTSVAEPVGAQPAGEGNFRNGSEAV